MCWRWVLGPSMPLPGTRNGSMKEQRFSTHWPASRHHYLHSHPHHIWRRRCRLTTCPPGERNRHTGNKRPYDTDRNHSRYTVTDARDKRELSHLLTEPHSSQWRPPRQRAPSRVSLRDTPCPPTTAQPRPADYAHFTRTTTLHPPAPSAPPRKPFSQPPTSTSPSMASPSALLVSALEMPVYST
jgi:hypothetical protein